MKISILFGELKFWIERIQSYFPAIALLINVYIAMNVGKISWYWYLSLIPATFVVYWFDRKFVVENYLAAFINNNPIWRKMFDQLERIEENTKK